MLGNWFFRLTLLSLIFWCPSNSTWSLNPLSLNALSYTCRAYSQAVKSLEMSVRRRLIDEGNFLILFGGWLDCRCKALIDIKPFYEDGIAQGPPFTECTNA